MNRFILTAITGILFFTQNATAQKNTDDGNKKQKVTKGYYSIGNNASKLQQTEVNQAEGEKKYPQISKGYYSIGRNNRKLPEQKVLNMPVPAKKAEKGYFTIGKNS